MLATIRRPRTAEQRETIEQAKRLVMKTQGLNEADAYLLLRRTSMHYQKPLHELAEAVLLSLKSEL